MRMVQLATPVKYGFTVLELLVTISLIVILVSALVVGMNSAKTGAMIAETNARLMGLRQSTVWFKEEVGYFPPLLDHQRNLKSLAAVGDPLQFPNLPTSTDYQTYRNEIQNWYSITTPTEYLLGYGDLSQDGYGRLPTSHVHFDDSVDQMPRLGITHPGLDGVWGATDAYTDSSVSGNGLFVDRRPRGILPTTHSPDDLQPAGKVFGPYLDINNDQMLGRISVNSSGDADVDPVTGRVKVYYPGETKFDSSQPLVLVDTWGTPIRFYRPMYPTHLPNIDGEPQIQNGVGRSFPPSNSYQRPTLSDYLVLRPFDFDPDKVVDGFLPDYRDGNIASGDTSTSIELQTGQFAYLSAGPDQKTNNRVRADVLGLAGNTGTGATDEVNKDNLIEVGP